MPRRYYPRQEILELLHTNNLAALEVFSILNFIINNAPQACSQISQNPISTGSRFCPAAETLAFKVLESTVLKGHCLRLK